MQAPQRADTSSPFSFPQGSPQVLEQSKACESLEHPALCWEGQSLALSATRICLGIDQYLARQQSDQLDQRCGFEVSAVVEGCSARQAPQRARASDSDEMLFGHSQGAFFPASRWLLARPGGLSCLGLHQSAQPRQARRCQCNNAEGNRSW